ncbi:MAG: ClbS/DfsB family four-helix bundle protein [Chloroflexi bacterium]|nr:ClbS/DfsB family four-helix bundle protein [Chloroflexota bacterium]
MTEQLTVKQLVAAMHAARSDWGALLAEVGEGRWEQPGVAGDWSIKDIIAHLTYFENWATEVTGALERGEPLPASPYQGMEIDQENAAIYQRYHARPLAEAVHESQAAFLRSLDVVQRLRDEDLYSPEFTRPAGVDWIVFDLIEGDTFGHYRDHIVSVRAWLEKTQVAEAAV